MQKIPQTILQTPILGYLNALGGPPGVKIFKGGGRAFPIPDEIFSKMP